MAIINLFLIALIVVFIEDYSGFIFEMESLLTKKLKSPIPFTIPKPLSCSLCMSFYLNLIYIITAHEFTLINIALVCIISALTPEILKIIYFIKDTISTIVDSIRILLGIREN